MFGVAFFEVSSACVGTDNCTAMFKPEAVLVQACLPMALGSSSRGTNSGTIACGDPPFESLIGRGALSVLSGILAKS